MLCKQFSSTAIPFVCLTGTDGVMLEPGLVEQAIEFVRRNIETMTLEDGVRKLERWTCSEETVRQAVVNAIVHRDYLASDSVIEIGIYSDRLKVASPGLLATGMTPEKVRYGCRSTRNELLRDVMRDYAYREHVNMGVTGTIMRRMKEYNGTEPDLIEDEDRFVVRLWKDTRSKYESIENSLGIIGRT